MSVLLDTNVILRRVQPDHIHHGIAIESIEAIHPSAVIA